MDLIKATLKDGLLTCEIWDREAGLSFLSHNPQPVGVALFTEVTKTLATALSDSGFPSLNRYYLVDLVLLCHKRSLVLGLPQQGHCPRRAISW